MWRRLNKILCKRSIAFTLVEIMVAVIITSMIAIAVVSLYSTGNRTFFQIIETNKLSNESLVLTTMIEKDLAMGGFTHPVRGNSEACESETGNLGIYPSDAVRITSDPSEGLLIISSCFDKSYSGSDGHFVERYKISYRRNNNILEKKIERTDDCNSPVDEEIEMGEEGYDWVNADAITHDWQPVSANIESFSVAEKPSYTAEGESFIDVIDLEIMFQSQRNEDNKLDFAKRIFLKNKSLDLNARLCAEPCRNATRPFENYVISGDESFWNPSNMIGGAVIKIDPNNFNSLEDELVWRPGVLDVPSYNDVTGTIVLSSLSGSDLQSLVNSMYYVYSPQPGTQNSIKRVSLLLYTDDCNAANTDYFNGNIYCRITADNLNWENAKTDAENTNYYSLSGRLIVIENDTEREFVDNNEDGGNNILDDNGKVWIGGQKIEDAWQWIAGREEDREIDEADIAVAEPPVELKTHLYFEDDGEQFIPAINADPEVNNYIIEFMQNARISCDGDHDGEGCVNQYFMKEIVTDDYTFTDPDSLNLCFS